MTVHHPFIVHHLSWRYARSEEIGIREPVSHAAAIYAVDVTCVACGTRFHAGDDCETGLVHHVQGAFISCPKCSVAGDFQHDELTPRFPT